MRLTKARTRGGYQFFRRLWLGRTWLPTSWISSSSQWLLSSSHCCFEFYWECIGFCRLYTSAQQGRYDSWSRWEFWRFYYPNKIIFWASMWLSLRKKSKLLHQIFRFWWSGWSPNVVHWTMFRRTWSDCPWCTGKRRPYSQGKISMTLGFFLSS